MNEVNFREMLATQGFPEPTIVERDANLVTTDHVHEFTASALISVQPAPRSVAKT